MPRAADSDRTLDARAAAHLSWAQTDDWSARTARGRRAFLNRFEDEVDPDRRLDPADRAARADQARKAYFAALAAKSVRARRARAADVTTRDDDVG